MRLLKTMGRYYCYVGAQLIRGDRVSGIFRAGELILAKRPCRPQYVNFKKRQACQYYQIVWHYYTSAQNLKTLKLTMFTGTCT